MGKVTFNPTLLVAGLAIAPVAATSSACASRFVATQSPGEQGPARIIGLSVENSAGERLGDIAYLVLDTRGKITTAIVGIAGVAGADRKNVGVPFDDLQFGKKNGRKIAIVDATKESFARAPKYVWTEELSMEGRVVGRQV